MIRTPFLGRAALLGLLFLGIVNLTATGQSPADRDQQIKDIQKQIQDLEAKIRALQERELLPAPKSVSSGIVPESWINAMKWRCIGPAIMGGRVTSIAVCESEPTTYWIATASGGLLKTVNNGVTFEHQFDRETVVSIGAVAVAPTDKNIVWVGTGEANPRNSVSWGDGVYKSTDGGKKWTNMGLKGSFQIGKIVVHPKNADIVYVAALGRLYGPNPERGLFKTTDGGKTWQKVLFVNDRTGVMDIAMHPSDPETLIVSTWERQRDEFDSFRGDAKAPGGADEYAPTIVHAPGSGLYRTTDGGKSFTKLTKGLPDARMGRIGVDFSRKNPDTLFAIIDTEKTGTGNPPPPEPTVGYLGIMGESVPNGAKLTSITEKSPAEKGGLKTDDIVTHFDGKPVKDYDSMVADLRKKKPNDKVKLTILRGADKKDLEITLGVRQGGVAKKDPNQPRPSLGIEIESAQGGVMIIGLLPKSPAEKAGLKVDDIITKIGDVPISDRRVIMKALFGKKNGDKVKIAYLRGKDPKETEVTLETVSPAPRERPNGDGMLGGQIANAQQWQGPDGVNTGGVFKSTDKGETWTRVNSVNPRPFYFSVLRVDPLDENVIYVLGVDLFRSTDGGKTFSADAINDGLHSDQHDMWINPKNSKHLLVGCDGGFYVSYDRAANWEHLNRMAMGQFYHVCVDNRRPYRVYGGLQDNGSWGGPSNTRRGNGPTNEDWIFVNGGDGFVCRVDPNDPDLIYAESQDGSLMRRNLRTGATSFVRPFAQAGLGRYRFNWNTPFILSSHNPSIYYSAGNYVFRSVKQGSEQRPISPEITRTRRGSATALSESPRNPDVLWVGTDDGAVHVTRDGGRTWANVTDNFRAAGLPGARWVASIEASRWDDGRAYVVFDAHRSNDDQPYVFVTENYGQSWKSLRGNLPAGSTRVCREDLIAKDLLYLGTEFAAWASIDRGQSWTRINGDTLPTVAIHEIAQPVTANEIVVATHGRSIWILDVSALRQLTPTVVGSSEPRLLTPSPAIRWQIQPGGTGPFFQSMRRFVGANPVRGATIDYILPQKAQRVTLNVKDISGRTVAELKGSTDPGLHRIVWNLQTVGLPRGFGGNISAADLEANPFVRAMFGQNVGAGAYRIVLQVNDKEFSTPLTVEGDPNAPRAAISAIDEVEQERELKRLEKKRPTSDDH